MNITDIPKRKPKDYPENRRWDWIGEVMFVHAWYKRVWGSGKVKTYHTRTDRGRKQVWDLLKKKFPYAFIKE